jgi:hypothetical protein
MEAVLIEMIIKAANEYPWATIIVVWVGVFRVTFKPVMAAVETYIAATPHKGDDEFLAKLKEHKIYKAVVWFVDYSMSIKLPK